jgi:hypothetical protein
MVMPLLFFALTDIDDPVNEDDEVKAETCETARRRVIAAATKDFILKG